MCVRTSIAFYGGFILDMDRSPGFGPAPSDSGPLQTRFPSGSGLYVLNLAGWGSSPDRSTKSTRFISYGCPAACRHRVSGALSLPSRGPFHLSFTVLYAIGHQGVFRLGGWSPRIPTGFHVSGGTLDTVPLFGISSTRLSRPSVCLPMHFDYPLQSVIQSEPRRHCCLRFGLFRVRSPLLAESRLISLPRPT